MITLDRQISCVRREIAMRRRVYPHWVESKKMTADKADEETAVMEAVLQTLEAVRRAAEGDHE